MKNDDEIKPDATPEEIKENAKKTPCCTWFMKQYKKGDIIYTITQPPFRKKRRVIACLHVPSQKLFGYNEAWQEWEEMGKWSDYCDEKHPDLEED